MLKVPPSFPLITARIQLLKLSWSLCVKLLGKVIFIRLVDAKMVPTSSVSTSVCWGNSFHTSCKFQEIFYIWKLSKIKYNITHVILDEGKTMKKITLGKYMKRKDIHETQGEGGWGDSGIVWCYPMCCPIGHGFYHLKAGLGCLLIHFVWDRVKLFFWCRVRFWSLFAKVKNWTETSLGK